MNATKKAILLAASQIFAAKGFDGASVREISARAASNLAAINYHFGSKEELYREVCEMLFAMPDALSLLKPPKKLSKPGGDWRELLALLIRNFMESAINGSPLFRCRFQIMFREMLAPSPFFPQIFEEHLKPRISALRAFLKGALGDSVSGDELNFWVFSMISQCLYYIQNRSMITAVTGQKNYVEDKFDAIVAHIAGGMISMIEAARMPEEKTLPKIRQRTRINTP